MLRGALPVRTVLQGREGVDRVSLIGYLRAPRYEVLPTADVEGLVVSHVPPEVTITITASPRRGMDATIGLAEEDQPAALAAIEIDARVVRDRHPPAAAG